MAKRTQTIAVPVDPEDPGTWFIAEDVAVRCDVSYDTVGDWLRSGELPGRKWGKRWRVRPSDLADFVDRRARGAGREVA